MKRKHKQYSRPKKSFDKIRFEEEGKIKEEFGLKNKKEIWKAESLIKSIREKAKKLIPSSQEEKEALFNRLRKIGFNVNSISDVLSLEKKDFLERRLQTIVFKKKLASTPKKARQLIVHKKVLVKDNVVDSPSHLVSVAVENMISLKKEKAQNIKKPLVSEEAQ
ncbi:MAG: 30S ribosomal protein S4 [Nanoarchaeota archaeon]|nr:30S ribosomal protein S4 [Nanoarchaeota archaeon]